MKRGGGEEGRKSNDKSLFLGEILLLIFKTPSLTHAFKKGKKAIEKTITPLPYKPIPVPLSSLILQHLTGAPRADLKRDQRFPESFPKWIESNTDTPSGGVSTLNTSVSRYMDF